MTTTSLDRAIDLRHYLHILWRRKGLVVLSGVTVVCAALVALAFMPKVYESRVTLYFDEQRPFTGEIEQLLGRSNNQSGSYGAEQSRSAGIVARIRSRPFLENVVAKLQMTNDPNARVAGERRRRRNPELTLEEATMRVIVQSLESRIRFASAAAGLYDVIVSDYKPEDAKVLAEWISTLFLDDVKMRSAKQFDEANEFSNGRIATYQEQLRRAEEALNRYEGAKIGESMSSSAVRAENLGIAENLAARLRRDADTADRDFGPYLLAVRDPRNPTSLVNSLRDDREITLIRAKLRSALADAINEQLSLATATTVAPELKDDWREPLTAPRRELFETLSRRARALEPPVSETAITPLVNATFSRIDAQINGDEAASLEGKIQTYHRQATSRPADELERQRLEDEVTKYRNLLETFRNQVLASQMRQSLEQANLGMRIDILNPAQLPLAPSRPNRLKILLAALLMGPLVGVGLAFLAETMDSTLRTLEEIQKIAPEPVLCTTPLLSKLQPRHRGVRRFWIPVTVSGVLLLTGVFFVARMTVLRDLDTRGFRAVAPTTAVESATGR